MDTRNIARLIMAPERYEIILRSLNQTVGKTTMAARIPRKCIESKLRPAQLRDAPGNNIERLSPSKIMISTQQDCRQA